LDDWSKAVRSGEMGSLSKYPSTDYQGFFGYKDASNITPTSRDEAIRGLQELLGYVVGSDHSAQCRIVKIRSDREAVLQTWRVENGEWKIVRETAENI
jgi:hypothetical protein